MVLELSSKKNSVITVVSWTFAVIWLLLISLDYFNKHPGFFPAIKYFQYPKLYLFLLAFFSGVVYLIKSERFKNYRIPVNGISLSIFLCILSFATIVAHKDYAFTETNTQQIFSFMGFAWSLIGFLFLLFMILQSAGRVVYRKAFKNNIKTNIYLDLALGLMLFISCLFVLGLFNVLMQNVIIALLFVFALINLFYLVQRIKAFLIEPIDVSGMTVLGILSFCILSYFILFNFLSALGPFPSGFDSRNFYMNISKLIADSNGLIEGYQPYYWSLFMSIGFSLFEKVELALALSYSGIVITVLVAYRFAVRHLNLNKNYVLFCLCLFVLTPAVTNQMYIELKVDFAMLFFQILSLEYLLILLKSLEDPYSNEDDPNKTKVNYHLIVLLGLLSSFALGIKMINMFMVFVIIILIWWNEKNKYGTLAAICLCLLLFLIAGIDEISGLGKYHLSEDIVKVLLGLIMIGSLTYSLVKNRSASLLRSKITIVYLIACGVFVLPWIIKNGVESKSLSPRTLLMGEDPGPDITLNKMVQQYENSKKTEN